MEISQPVKLPLSSTLKICNRFTFRYVASRCRFPSSAINFYFYSQNNLVKGNQGGVAINADSRGSATSLRAYIHHNLFVENRNRPTIYAEGRQSSPYQSVTIFKNYFSQNRAAYADVIVLRQVVSNFSYNYVHSNSGGRIVEISGFDKVRLPIYQTTSHNGFYE